MAIQKYGAIQKVETPVIVTHQRPAVPVKQVISPSDQLADVAKFGAGVFAFLFVALILAHAIMHLGTANYWAGERMNERINNLYGK